MYVFLIPTYYYFYRLLYIYIYPKGKSDSTCQHIQYSTKVFGALEPLSRFFAISPKQMQISTPNFQHPLSHHFHTFFQNFKVHCMIGRPQITSE